MSENLKKAFMKGVCAMNMEAMTILTGAEEPQFGYPSFQSEMTPARVLSFTEPLVSAPHSEISEHEQLKIQEMKVNKFPEESEKPLYSGVLSTPIIKGTAPTEGIISSTMKIESKDHQWKPAPIMGGQIQPKIVNNIEPMQSLNPNMRIPKSTLGEGLVRQVPIIEQDTYVESMKIPT